MTFYDPLEERLYTVTRLGIRQVSCDKTVTDDRQTNQYQTNKLRDKAHPSPHIILFPESLGQKVGSFYDFKHTDVTNSSFSARNVTRANDIWY